MLPFIRSFRSLFCLPWNHVRSLLLRKVAVVVFLRYKLRSLLGVLIPIVSFLDELRQVILEFTGCPIIHGSCRSVLVVDLVINSLYIQFGSESKLGPNFTFFLSEPNIVFSELLRIPRRIIKHRLLFFHFLEPISISRGNSSSKCLLIGLFFMQDSLLLHWKRPFQIRLVVVLLHYGLLGDL